jgi:mannosyl-3-phosphoglycerate phosphatase
VLRARRILAFVDLDAAFGPSQDRFAATRTLRDVAGSHGTVVWWSSKTRVELQQLQSQMAVTDPFVCESGAAVLIPDACVPAGLPHARRIGGFHLVEFGKQYSEVVRALHRAAGHARVQIVGFNEMSIADVARECRLTLLEAQLAKNREYEEPFRFVTEGASARARLLKAFRAARLRCTTVGRYEHGGAFVDTRRVVGSLSSLWHNGGYPPLTVGFSTDSRGLFDAVDLPILMSERTMPGTSDVAERATQMAQILEQIVHTGEAPTASRSAT